ncbi:putative mediator of RNA polymerase II transcription subunit 24 isoform X2 [Leptopilina boulardi]|uniref:putative mediator of RNA polymerase II transcription subunit 24 isoform X2 n=1 Tax=Leptopilina boulardi TaxID=63433 RepID=UPI0021F58FBB|nr:putative mediator of RNA polymerase II transcription subunit 24 isoform X2 [Leptopilina boulardi]
MVRPSHPKLMAKVLDAVAILSESKGSSIRDILQIVKKGSSGPNRNLTMQVQRALKHAVTAGILRHRNGRYKNAIALSKITHPSNKRRFEDDYKVVDDMSVVDESKKTAVDPLSSIHDRGNRAKKRRGSRSRKGSRRRRKGSRRRGRRRGDNEEYQEMAPENNNNNNNNNNNKKSSIKQSKVRDDDRPHKRIIDKYSEISGSEHESRLRNRKSKPDNGLRRSNSRHDQRKELSDKTKRRSQSRHRSQTRNDAPIEDFDNQNAMDCDDDANENDNSGRDANNCDTKNCGSESSL